jgi:penicillin amidase
MAKIIRLVVFLLLTLALVIGLDNQFGSIPALGKFLNPYSGFWSNSEGKHFHLTPPDSKYLKDSVHIYFDEDLIPHIYAKNDDDLYFAQGYVVARLRLWQMEFQTHFAAGRISEIVGGQALSLDRRQRRKGLSFGARNTLEAYKKDDIIWSSIEAFTAGANAYIENLNPKDYPLEYKLLGYKPEPWSPFKTALLLQYMSDNLAGWDEDLQNTNARRLFGAETFDLLFDISPEGLVPVIEKNGDWDFEPLAVKEPDSVTFPNDTILYTVTMPDPDNGSNNWAVSGSKTITGKPILCNDTHLSLNFPPLWLTMHLKSPSVDVMGYTFTGSPGIIIGFNDSISWGFTNSPRDTKDWYKISFNNDKSAYSYDGAWKEARYQVEEIKIKGGDTFYDTVYYTHYGPVVYDENFPEAEQKQSYALRWTGHDVSMLLRTFYQLNRGNNYTDYKNALKYWDCPPQNIVFASNGGDIGLTIQGKFPLKWRNQGRFLMDGSDPEQEWQSFVPKSHSIKSLNPERAYVSSANQHQTDTTYPYFFYAGNDEYYRNRTLNRILDTMQEVSIAKMQQLQVNNHSMKAEEYTPLMLRYLENETLNEEESEAVRHLTSWDYHYEKESKAGIYFDAWWKNFYRLVWDEFDIENIPLNRPDPYITYLVAINNPEFSFFDLKETEKTETLKDLVVKAFRQSIIDLNEWKKESGLPFEYANYRFTRIVHLSRVPALGIENLKTGGHPDALNSIKGSHGPSQRLIVSHTDKVEAYGMFPGGQSGNPGSFYYDHFVEYYENGVYRPLRYHFDPSKSNVLYAFNFSPTSN